ncbi:unnamed protein product, partial [Ectocarpus sp. 12 AP-2014]
RGGARGGAVVRHGFRVGFQLTVGPISTFFGLFSPVSDQPPAVVETRHGWFSLEGNGDNERFFRHSRKPPRAVSLLDRTPGRVQRSFREKNESHGILGGLPKRQADLAGWWRRPDGWRRPSQPAGRRESRARPSPGRRGPCERGKL